MPSYDPICLLCARLRDSGMTCDAFPDGIPSDIVQVKSLHLKARDGDRGLTFALRDDDATREAAQAMVDAKLLPAMVLER